MFDSSASSRMHALYVGQIKLITRAIDNLDFQMLIQS